MKTVNIDADLANADWTKTAWDLPPYKSAEFFALVPIDQLDAFRKLPVYLAAVDSALIIDDEWAADYITAPKTADRLPHDVMSRIRRRVTLHIHQRKRRV